MNKRKLKPVDFRAFKNMRKIETTLENAKASVLYEAGYNIIKELAILVHASPEELLNRYLLDLKRVN